MTPPIVRQAHRSRDRHLPARDRAPAELPGCLLQSGERAQGKGSGGRGRGVLQHRAQALPDPRRLAQQSGKLFPESPRVPACPETVAREALEEVKLDWLERAAGDSLKVECPADASIRFRGRLMNMDWDARESALDEFLFRSKNAGRFYGNRRRRFFWRSLFERIEVIGWICLFCRGGLFWTRNQNTS